MRILNLSMVPSAFASACVVKASPTGWSGAIMKARFALIKCKAQPPCSVNCVIWFEGSSVGSEVHAKDVGARRQELSYGLGAVRGFV